MKAKSISFVVAAIFCSMTVAAQHSIGLKAGVNLANYNSDYVYVASSDVVHKVNPLLSVGLFADLGLGQQLSLQPEINYLERGVLLNERGSSVKYYDLTWKFLQVPLLLKYRIPSDLVNFYIAAGPSIGYAYAGKEDLKGWNMADGESGFNVITDVRDYVFRSEDDTGTWYDNRWDVGLDAAIGFDFRMGIGHLNLEARYGRDFTENTQFHNESPNDYTRSQHRDLIFSLGYSIPLGD